MKRIILLALIVFSLLACHSEKKQTKKEGKNHLQEMGLKGRVKSLREINTITPDVTDLPFDYVYSYNEDGNKIEESMYFVDAEMAYTYRGKLRQKYTYQYNEKGLLTEQLFFSSDLFGDLFGGVDKGVNLTAKIIFQYNQKGDLIQKNMYEGEDKLVDKYTYLYDEQGNKNEERLYSSAGQYIGKIKFLYDDKKNLIEEVSYNAQGNSFMKKNYQYDSKNNLIEQKWYINDQSPQHWIWKYDDNHNKIEEYYSYSDTDENKEKENYSYQALDSQGNWIKRSTYKNNKLLITTERIIEYY